MSIYTSKDGAIRLFDATAHPFYIELFFTEGNFSAPEGRARPEEIPILDRGQLDSNAHYIDGSDEPIIAPVELTFSVRLDDTKMKTRLRQALNLDALSTWLVGSDTWLTTKGTTQLLSSSGSLVTTPLFTSARRRTVNVEVLWADPDGSGNIGRKYAEVYFAPERTTLTESEDGVRISAVGLVYGAITSITAFTPSSNES